MFNLPSLSQRCKYLDLCALYKIVHKDFNFPSGTLNYWQDKTHSTNAAILKEYFTYSNSLYHSFFPRTIRTWSNYITIRTNNSLGYLSISYGYLIIIEYFLSSVMYPLHFV